MGNEQKKKGPPVKIPTAAEIKIYNDYPRKNNSLS